MVVLITCITLNGLPVFSRRTALLEKQLNFSALAPLNGIQMYGKAQAVNFINVQGKDFIIYWKSYYENFCLILVGKNLFTDCVEEVLDVVFNSVIMMVGLDEIINMKHIDRFKRDIRSSFPVIDRIMKTIDECKDCNDNSDILSLTEVLISPDYSLLQEKLESWSESICSLFCCLLVASKVAVATPAWWNLSNEEKSLLTTLIVSCNSSCTSIDIPVFLLHNSPSTPFRLVSCCLMADVWLCALCGPTPDLPQFEECSILCWNSLVDNLKSILSLVSRNIPYSFDIHPTVIGFLLINLNVGKYVLTGCLADKSNNSYISILKKFYYQNVKYLVKTDYKDHKVWETYWSTENYKLHASLDNNNILCVMYSSTIANNTMRIITKDMLHSIKSNKLFNW